MLKFSPETSITSVNGQIYYVGRAPIMKFGQWT